MPLIMEFIQNASETGEQVLFIYSAQHNLGCGAYFESGRADLPRLDSPFRTPRILLQDSTLSVTSDQRLEYAMLPNQNLLEWWWSHPI